MSADKPSIPRGTRDFGPEVMAKRKFIIHSIESVFKKYGFLPIETPTMENLSVLTGKYGDEGDQLIFKVLNSGNFLDKIDLSENLEAKKLTPKIAEKALRYDLTVPFARFVVMNRNDIALPFKRYQIQPVWRADRPQKGRYREFYQCDADVVGTDSLLCEAEIVSMLKDSFNLLGIESFSIHINNRKILTGIADVANCEGREGDLCVAIDKLDKIGKEKVLEELQSKGFSEDSLKAIDPIFNLSGSNEEKLTFLKTFLQDSPTGLQGIQEIEEILQITDTLCGNTKNLVLDITLARGLSYYTGAIFEVKAHGVSIGSISGGGRYDNLTGVFGMPGISGVGISFGIDRIYDVLEELNLFPTNSHISSQILICYFDTNGFTYGLKVLAKLRNSGISAELYPEVAKMKKQLGYANSKNIPFVLLVGDEEIQTGELTLKNMISGDQEKLTIELLTKNFQTVV